MTETKENLIEYYGVLNPEEIVNDDMSYEELFYKTHGITYDQYLRETEELEKRTHKINYKNIPQRKLVLKKNNIKFVKVTFLQNLNTFQTIVKPKKGKRIMLLNFFIRETVESSYLLDVFCYDGAKVGRNNNNDLIVSFSKEIPVSFEIHYFTIKVKEDEPLQVFKETIHLMNSLTPKMYEITENVMKKLH